MIVEAHIQLSIREVGGRDPIVDAADYIRHVKLLTVFISLDCRLIPDPL